MTSHALLPRLVPGFYLLALLLLAWLLHFNGLYGQDAHEYLRQSRVIFDRWYGLPVPAPGVGDAEFAGGYPLLGALLRLLLGDSVFALQLVSFLAAVLGLMVFERLLALLAPGARAESRWVFGGLALALSPMFFRAGMCSMSDALGLLFALSAFFFGLRVFDSRHTGDVMAAAGLAVFGCITRYAFVALLLPMALALGWFLVSNRKWRAIGAAVLTAGLALLPHFWLKMQGQENPFGHSMLRQWSVLHFFQHNFQNENGLAQYTLPNILYVLSTFLHPALGLALPGLFFLAKKTDLALPAKRILLASIVCYLILLGGLPHQNTRYLLPAYALLLLLLFPAWDRLYCYGFLFFRRLTGWILIGVLALQLFFCVKYLKPVLQRQRLEKEVAIQLQTALPPNATVYAFDLDGALRSYLPELQFRNLWERRYPEYTPGHYVLFNEALRPQWQGQNPILNWDDLKATHNLRLKAELPEGWGLWEIQ